MRKVVNLLVVLVFSAGMMAQEKSFEQQVKEISNQITEITESEKDLLKSEVAVINKKLELGEISAEDAERMKREASEKRAKNIQSKITVQEEKLKELVEARANGEVPEDDSEIESFQIGNNTITVKSGDWDWDWEWSDNDDDDYKSDRNYKKSYDNPRRTSSQFVFAFGFNNVIVDHDFSTLTDSDYKMDAFFFELGGSGKTRMSKKASILYIKYGFSFLWNNLRPSNNQYFEFDGTSASLETYPVNLKNSARLRNIELVFPVHLEFDFTKPKVREDYVRYRQGKAFRMGLGGYGGFRLQTKQFIKYYQNDLKFKEKSRGNYGVNSFIYGLSAYAGYKATSLYMKYDMNPLFKEGDERNISLGMRFDFN